jgi:hypothetical protein
LEEVTVDNRDKLNNGQKDSISPSNAGAKTRKRSRMWLLIVISFGAVAVCVCLSLVALLFVAAGAFTTSADNQDDWLALSDAYMQAMAAKDVGTAYQLFSQEARREMGQSEFTGPLEGPLFALFDGYEDLDIGSWQINYYFPEGKTVELTGYISYRENVEGSYEAILVEEDGQWKIHWFYVSVAPEKINDFAKGSIP